MSEESLFHDALSKSPAERAAFLDAACAGQPELRAAVEALLAAHDASGGLLDRPPIQVVDPEPGEPNYGGTGEYTPQPIRTTDHRPEVQPGLVIAGRYVLQQKIGEGGMGEVWVAKQTEPVKRKVALKLIKTGMDSRAVLTRFEQERQALAMMDHPNIARVLDGGLTPTGQPFFVMELVNGLPLTKFCDEARLGIRERLELFATICQAVQHAHHKGIVHRDLKPANILVTVIDGRGVPKVIDFGVAKATAGKLTDESMSTQFGAVVGTLEYMSPEQAGFSGIDIDTRADIYSLGVILYELLTGLKPIDAGRLKKAAFNEMIRIIREEEPSRPSTRLSTDESLPSLAALRQTEPKKLMAILRGELDWVVMKCLEKKRDRRYETANGLARDIQRYLADEAVEARPPSAGYRLGKLLKRNKGSVVAASLVLLALLVGMTGTTWGLFEAKRQEQIARDEASEKEQARADEAEQRSVAEGQKEKALRAAAAEKAANGQAQKRLKQIEKANDILGSIFENLDPKEIARAERPLQAILVEKLDKAVAQLEGESIGDPLVVASMQGKFGRSLFGLGEYGKAVVLLEKARATFQAKLGREHPSTLTSMNNLAGAYQDAGKLALALPLYEETLKLRKAKLGAEHPDTLTTMNDLAVAYQAAGKRDLALPLLEETLKLTKAKLGAEHPDTLTTMNNLAVAYQAAGKLDLALPLYEETLKLTKARLGPYHPHTLASMNNLAMVYRAAGKLALALPLYEETLKLRKAKLGPEHPSTLGSMNNLAAAYQAAGKLDLALPLFEETLKLMKAKLDPEHPDTLASMNGLAAAYLAAGKLDLAVPLFEETLKLRKAKLGAEHPDTLTSMNDLAQAYQAAGKRDLALLLFEETLKLSKAKLGPDHPSTLTSTNNLANAYRAAGKLDLALPLFEETLKLRKAKLGPDHPHTLNSMNNLAAAYWSAKQLDKSIPLFEETMKRREAKLGRDHPETLQTVANLGVNYKDASRLKEAIPLLEEAYRAAKKYPTLQWVGGQLLDAYTKAGENAKFAALLLEQLIEARKALPKASPQLAGLLAQLGLTLLEQKKGAEAEPLIRESLAIREKTQPDAWSTFNAKSMLGGALLGQKKYADAEPLLLAGYEGMKKREKTIPPQGRVRLTEAVERLVQLYEATGKPDEVKKWQAARAKYPKDAAKPSEKK
jgi:eukaryotic-like serine/threonine-protein kinase